MSHPVATDEYQGVRPIQMVACGSHRFCTAGLDRLPKSILPVAH
jgi:hypothetical protein